jgi:hypothetical protein
MITATVQEVRLAFVAISRINEEVKLPQKAAWRVSRLLGQLKPVVADFETTQLKLFKDAGAQEKGGGLELKPPERNGEDDLKWTAVLAEHEKAVNELNTEMRALNEQVVEINYDAIPLSLFDDPPDTPVEKQRVFYANDFLNAGQFIRED